MFSNCIPVLLRVFFLIFNKWLLQPLIYYNFAVLRTLRLFEPRPLWNRVGGFWSGRSLPVGFQVVLFGPKTVRKTVGRHATDSEKIRRHGHRDIHRSAGLSTSGPVKRTGFGHAGDDIADQAEFHRKIVGDREDGEGHARRKRDQWRVPRDQTPGKPGNREHLRGNVRHPRPGFGSSDHRDSSVQIVITDIWPGT